MAIDVVLALLVVFWVLACWFLICNERTSRARSRLIDHTYYYDSNWGQRSKWFEQSSYSKHVWSLFFFRDPWKQYDPRLLKGFER